MRWWRIRLAHHVEAQRSLVTLLPIYWLFVISVKPAVELFSTPDVILDSFYRNNYVEVLNDSTLRR